MLCRLRARLITPPPVRRRSDTRAAGRGIRPPESAPPTRRARYAACPARRGRRPPGSVAHAQPGAQRLGPPWISVSHHIGLAPYRSRTISVSHHFGLAPYRSRTDMVDIGLAPCSLQCHSHPKGTRRVWARGAQCVRAWRGRNRSRTVLATESVVFPAPIVRGASGSPRRRALHRAAFREKHVPSKRRYIGRPRLEHLGAYTMQPVSFAALA